MSQFSFYQPLSGVVRHLIIINVLLFFGSYVLLGDAIWSTAEGAYVKLGRLHLAAFIPGSQHFQPFQLCTYMFMHNDLGHLAFNMLSLYFFGPLVEMVWGHRRFLFYYLFCGVGAYALHMGLQYWELSRIGVDVRVWDGVMLGASGCVFGVLAAFAWQFPDRVISLIFPPIELKAKYFVPIMAGIELYYGVRGSATGIAHYAHLGGAAAGLLLILIWERFRLR
jgi:membrane associated rhomboid family serine protease